MQLLPTMYKPLFSSLYFLLTDLSNAKLASMKRELTKFMVVGARDITDVKAGKLRVPQHLEEGGVTRLHVDGLVGLLGLAPGRLKILRVDSVDNSLY